jgi:hypothetical protein
MRQGNCISIANATIFQKREESLKAIYMPWKHSISENANPQGSLNDPQKVFLSDSFVEVNNEEKSVNSDNINCLELQDTNLVYKFGDKCN